MWPPADEEKREREVEEFLRSARKEMHERELILQKISNTCVNVKSSSKSAVEANERLFSEMILSLEKIKEDLNKTIQEQEKALLSQAQQEEQQQRSAMMSLQATIADVESLSQTKENIYYIEKSQLIILQKEETETLITLISDNLSFEFVKRMLGHLKQNLEEFYKEAIESIQKTVRNMQVVKSSEEKQKKKILLSAQVHPSFTDISGPRPHIELRKKRQEFLKYACPVTLDPDTAHPNLNISDNNTKAFAGSSKRQKKKLSLSTFDSWEQVLCKEDLRGGHFYWEVEWSGMGAFIGVVRKNFPRKGEGMECGLGHNLNSWCLQCSNATYYAWHDDNKTIIPIKVFSPRIGIFLDHSAGSLEFYTVSDKMTLLHRFTLETCPGPLYPAFGLGLGLQLLSSIKINKLENT